MTLSTIAAILQQSEYDAHYFEEWYQRHHSDAKEIKAEKETLKLKVVTFLLTILFFIPLLLRVQFILMLVHFIERIVRQVIYLMARAKLAWLKKRGLTVVAIAGSYGKTSTKVVLEQLLSSQTTVLVTPKSINTPLGISHVILNDLHGYHKVFVAELGEYYKGDIAALANFVKPDLGIVTPIGRQHLERMGDIETIAATIGELIEFFPNPKKVIVAEQNIQYFPNFSGSTYGESETATYRVSSIKVSRSGTEFELQDLKGKHTIFTPLYGVHQAINMLPSFWVANALGLDKDLLVQKAAALAPVTRRHEPTFLDHDILILDNSFNTNPDSINASLDLFKQLNPTHKILVTMGFVELGENSQKIHTELGEKLAKKIDYLGLLESPQTKWIHEGWIKGGGKKSAITTGVTAEDVLQHMQTAIIPGSLIILEGGYKELYS